MDTFNGKTILVTGATDGLGKQVALDLAAGGAIVLLHGRSQQKGEATLEEIRKATGNRKLVYYNADLASFDAVRRLSDEIRATQRRLDVLINNAGIGAGSHGDRREESAEGYELRFAVNYLAPFLLTHRLLPLLRQSAPAHIINVSSVGQQRIDFDNVMLENGYDGLRAYRQSKLAQVMFTFDLAVKLRDSSITVNSLHPASLMNTKMVLETDYFGSPMTTIEEGARAVEYLATSSELEGVTGEFFDGIHRARANSQAYDQEARRRLWRLSEHLVQPEEAGD
jgi:NAD(P)-dependent dehydrogenase (short-subunit alcohol dehydrogenase family)